MSLSSVHPITVPVVAATPEGPALLGKDFGLVSHVPVTLTAVVGQVALSVEALFALRKGDLLAMDSACDAPVTLLLNGKPIARGELVAVEDTLGLRITELT